MSAQSQFWNFWATLNWVRDVGGARVLAGELLLILGACLALFFDLTARFSGVPFAEITLVPVSLGLGILFLASGLRAHAAAGLRWFEWAWDGER